MNIDNGLEMTSRFKFIFNSVLEISTTIINVAIFMNIDNCIMKKFAFKSVMRLVTMSPALHLISPHQVLMYIDYVTNQNLPSVTLSISLQWIMPYKPC